MPQSICAVLVLSASFFLESAFAQPRDVSRHIAPTDPLSPAEQLKRFRVPPGFEVQLVAAEPDVRKPINLNFDARGRLLVTGSVEYPFPTKAKTGRDRVVALEDFGPEGRARKASTLVEGLNIPIGVTPAKQGAVVYSVPNLFHCRDSNGDGKLDRRRVLLGPFGFGDTHGMINNLTRWIDGWVYACHGYANTSQVAAADGGAIRMHSGNTFRFRPDGSRVEYFTHGQVNPFGLAFDEWGNVFSTDCHTLPAYQLLRGAWYPSFGKPHDGLGFGPAMMSHQHGSTGLAGIAYYQAEQFPPEYRGTLFIGNPITHRVNHDRLKRNGTTFQAVEQPDFLVCDDPWFRPVDVKLGPDGALYVADFYNRIIGHYEVPLDHPGRDRERGRIWRVVYRGKNETKPPEALDLTAFTTEKLIDRLHDPNLTLRRLAVNQLADRGADAAEQVRRRFVKLSEAARAFGLWILERAAPLKPETVRRLAGDKPLVRVHLVKAIAERTKWTGDNAFLFPLTRELLNDDDPFVRRAAAEALGRHPADENFAELLRLWEATAKEDTHLIHAVRIALRDHLMKPETYPAIKPLLARKDGRAARVAELSLGVKGPAAGDYLLSYLTKTSRAPRFAEFLLHATRHVEAGRLPGVYRLALSRKDLESEQQIATLRAVHQGLSQRGKTLPKELNDWATELAGTLCASENENQLRAGVELIRDLRLGALHEPLAKIISGNSPINARSLAVEAYVAIRGAESAPLLGPLMGDGRQPLDLRKKAAEALGSLDDDECRNALLRHLKKAPQALAVQIAHGVSRTPTGARRLLEHVEQEKAPPRLLQDRVVIDNLRRAKIPGVDQRMAALTAGLPSLDERMRELIETRRASFALGRWDEKRGAAVFKKICAACHRLGGEGKKIGPELDGVGLRGVDRLLEDVLDPSRNVDKAFRRLQVVTTDGRALTGLKLREEGQVLVLADQEGKEVRLPLAQVQQQQLTRLSPMPANVGGALPAEEFYHLLTFLLGQRTPAIRQQD